MRGTSCTLEKAGHDPPPLKSERGDRAAFHFWSFQEGEISKTLRNMGDFFELIFIYALHLRQ